MPESGEGGNSFDACGSGKYVRSMRFNLVAAVAAPLNVTVSGQISTEETMWQACACVVTKVWMRGSAATPGPRI